MIELEPYDLRRGPEHLLSKFLACASKGYKVNEAGGLGRKSEDLRFLPLTHWVTSDLPLGFDFSIYQMRKTTRLSCVLFQLERGISPCFVLFLLYFETILDDRKRFL